MNSRILFNDAPAAFLARRLQHELLTKRGNSERVPGPDELTSLSDRWLGAEVKVCRKLSECPGIESCGFRCDGEYWIRHHDAVSDLMGRLAGAIEEPVELYRAAGALYRLDYLTKAHDVHGLDPVEGHPFPLTKELTSEGYSADLCLAVLENAPHLGLSTSVPVSHALAACGSIVTLAAADIEMKWPIDLPLEWAELFKRVPSGGLADPTVDAGRFHTRVVPALRTLRDVLNESPLFADVYR